MSPASRSKSKDKKAGKEPQKTPSKPSGHVNAGSGPVSGYNPLLGKFQTLETTPLPWVSPLNSNGRFHNIDETDDQTANVLGTGLEYDVVSNNGSWSGESEDTKDKTLHQAVCQEAIPGADNDKREKIRQKNERKHQRQKERRAQELHERCSGFLMSRKLEALAQQLVGMGFSSERATMALILNEGKIEESVAWLFEGVEEADKYMEHNLDGGNLKIDISEELAQIANMEVRYNCSKQEVERAVVTCEGDLVKATETLRSQKQEPSSAPSKFEETGDPPTAGNAKFPVAVTQDSLRTQPRPGLLNNIQQRREEKEFNYTKAVTVGVPTDTGNKIVQPLRKVQPKLEWPKPQQIPIPTDKRWPNVGSSSSVSYSMASPLQVTPPAKTETQYVSLGSELKNLQLGSVKEPVVVMQRSQVSNPKLVSNTSASSSPLGAAAGWPQKNVVLMKPSALLPHIPSTRSISPSSLGSNQLYSHLHYQQHQQLVSSSNGAVDLLGKNQGNNLWNRMGTSPTLAAASSLGLFSGLGSNSSSGSSSPIDWNTCGSMLQLDYTNIDWSLDRSTSSSRSGGMWQNNSSYVYDSYPPGLGARSAMGPALAHSNGSGISLIGGLQENGVAAASAETSSAGGSREWSSPFEEKDLFSLPRQFVFSPSL